MSSKNVIAVILIALGIVVLAYSGITFKTPGKPVDFLRSAHRNHPQPLYPASGRGTRNWSAGSCCCS